MTKPNTLSSSTEVSKQINLGSRPITCLRPGALCSLSVAHNVFWFVLSVSSAIVERIPNALTMRNQIPKSYLHHDLYCNLIPNDDENIPYFQQVPRTGSFEVSYKGLVSETRLLANFLFILFIVDFF